MRVSATFSRAIVNDNGVLKALLCMYTLPVEGWWRECMGGHDVRGGRVGPRDRICQLPKAKHSIYVFTTDTVMGRCRRVIVIVVAVVAAVSTTQRPRTLAHTFSPSVFLYSVIYTYQPLRVCPR